VAERTLVAPPRDKLVVPHLVNRMQRGFRAALDGRLRWLGLSASQYAVLRKLEDEPGMSGADLSRGLHMTAQAAQELLATLVAAGLVERVDDPHHGRIRRAWLTPEGQDLVRRGAVVATAVQEQMLALLGADEREALIDYLGRCVEAVEAPVEEPAGPGSEPARTAGAPRR
jgi:DNA-binding MarR family transcriptional regulator